MKNTPFLFSLLLVAIVILGFGAYKYYNLEKNLEFSSVRADQLNTQLISAKAQNDSLLGELNQYKNISDSFAGQIASITDTVVGYAKLTTTDPQLLQKYSKVFFLNENYVPQGLVRIDIAYTYNKQEEYFLSKVLPQLLSLINDARNAGNQLQIISGYRSFETQSTLKSGYKMTYGAGTANQFSADQGYSEHQLGTAIDFTTPKIAATFSGFSKTESYKWLLQNAYKYGFILSYPQNNSYYQFEPWHWRFVGIALAKSLHDENKNFYDLDQREINKYLVNFFDQN